jgi:hypothetical protein
MKNFFEDISNIAVIIGSLIILLGAVVHFYFYVNDFLSLLPVILAVPVLILGILKINNIIKYAAAILFSLAALIISSVTLLPIIFAEGCPFNINGFRLLLIIGFLNLYFLMSVVETIIKEIKKNKIRNV